MIYEINKNLMTSYVCKACKLDLWNVKSNKKTILSTQWLARIRQKNTPRSLWKQQNNAFIT
jgi:hypothetical protein